MGAGYNPTQNDVKTVVAEAGRGGLVEYAALSKALASRQKVPESEDHIRDAFKVFDKTGSGAVDVKELRHILTTLGEKLSPQEVPFFVIHSLWLSRSRAPQMEKH